MRSDSDDDAIAALYAAAPDQFVAARDALAKRLREAGDRAGAARVRRLRRPTRAAWALNVAAREHPELVAALAEAVDALHAAHRDLLGGGADATSLRDAEQRVRAAADAVAAAAPATDPPTLEKIRATLRAAAVDADVLAEIARSRLLREQVASGFGDLGGIVPPAAPAPRAAGRRAAARDAAPAAPRRAAPQDAARMGAPAADDSAAAPAAAEAAELERTAAERAAAEKAAAERAAAKKAAAERAAAEKAAAERAAAEKAAAERAAAEKAAAERAAAERARRIERADAAVAAAEDELAAAARELEAAERAAASRRAEHDAAATRLAEAHAARERADRE